ncbi:MAG TPA: histidine--tRNA ligase [Gemmatimonadales bacterium]|nr:histidine--tRNA ligase [Gemmatimonadales bacterium]
MPSQALPGFRDFYPEDFAFRTHIFDTWRRVATRYGFEEYDGPPLEALDLYTRKSGAEIVSQLYNFRDKGDREVALRPEMTPTLARMVAARANGLRKPIRWFSIAQMFRYERHQRGRLREHFQVNCDVFGEAGPMADAEVIALLIDIARGFGLGPGDVRLRISDRRVLTALLRGAGVGEDQTDLAFTALDKYERLDRKAIEGLLEGSAGAGLNPGTIAKVLEIPRLQGLEQVGDALAAGPGGAGALAPLRATVDALTAMGLGDYVDVDLTIVRGLAYYTGTVFELFDASRSLRAIAGGGRYDDLLGLLGGTNLAAVGFAMGDVVLGELLKDRKLVPASTSRLDVFVAAVTESDLPDVLRLVHQCREAGLRTEFALTPQAVGKQLKLADARNARFAVVIGPDDRARNEVQIKDLVAKAQHAVGRSEAVASLLTALA